ncbi:MAG: antibiotic biosynthesis monooxygenase [Ilumatobacteraceae bacterium]
MHQDAEDRLRLVFVEHWIDADALRAHFAVSAAQAFVREMSPLADGPPEIAVYGTQPVTV